MELGTREAGLIGAPAVDAEIAEQLRSLGDLIAGLLYHKVKLYTTLFTYTLWYEERPTRAPALPTTYCEATEGNCVMVSGCCGATV